MGILLDITIYSVIHHNPLHITQLANHPKCSVVYVVPTGMEETPKAALDIHCLQRGGGVALTRTIN